MVKNPSGPCIEEHKVGFLPGIIQMEGVYEQLHMYILCRFVPETTHWLAFKIYLSTSAFEHGDPCMQTKTHKPCAQQVKKLQSLLVKLTMTTALFATLNSKPQK
jgi:hypothetical protein